MHPIEHIGYMSLLLLFFIIPAHPIHFLFMGFWLALATATSHSGYENLVLGEKAHLKIGTFHHQLHHRFFECNYGILKCLGIIGLDLIMTVVRKPPNGLKKYVKECIDS